MPNALFRSQLTVEGGRLRVGGAAVAAGLVLLGLLYTGLALLLPGPSFFNVDANIKWTQVHALVQSGWRSDGIPDPSLAIDPSGELSPFRTSFAGAFFYPAGGQWHGKYSLLFALLNSVPVALLGRSGVLLSTVLPALGVLLVLARMARRMGLRYPLAPVLLLGLCTPLLFYAIVFWEHALGLLPALVAVDAALDLERPPVRRALLAGLTAALSVVVRVEFVCLVPVVGLMLVLRRQPSEQGGSGRPVLSAQSLKSLCWFGLALAAGLGPLLLLNLVQSGSPLGAHLAQELDQRDRAHGPLSLLTAQIPIAAQLLLPQRFRAGWLALTPLAALAALAAGRLRGWRRGAEVGAGLLLATTAAALLWGLRGSFNSPDDLVSAGGVAALALLWPLRREHTPADRWAADLLLVAALFAALVLVTLPNPGGDQWGPRYLLLLYPLLVLPACLGIERLLAEPGGPARPALLGLALAVALGSLAIGAQSFAFARRWHITHNAVVQSVRDRPHSVFVTDSWGFPHIAATALGDQALVGVEDEAQVRRLSELLRQQGRGRIVWVSAVWRIPHHWQSAPTPDTLNRTLEQLGWVAAGPTVEDAASYRYTVYEFRK